MEIKISVLLPVRLYLKILSMCELTDFPIVLLKLVPLENPNTKGEFGS